jgi:hypothetical protein
MAEAARLALAGLPVVAIALAVLALRSHSGEAEPGSRAGSDKGASARDDPVAPVRLAIVRGALAIGAVAVVAVELLSTVDRIDVPTFVVFWLLVIGVVGGLAVRRGRPSRLRLPTLTRAEWAVAAGLAVLVLAELVLALASAPNNYDSNYYHLSKVEHWVANHNVDVYATVQIQQVAFAPGGEYLLLHLRLLTGGDAAYNLVQWCAGLGAALAVSRIAAQLGAGRLGQLLAAAVFLTAPMVVLESTSTQTDLIVTAWVACAATLAVDGLHRRSKPAEVVALGAAAGLTAMTKTTGLMGLAAVLLLWGIAQLRLGGRPVWPGVSALRAFARTAGASLAIVAIGLAIFGPFTMRMQQTFGAPLGPPDYNRGLSMQRHDPPALLVNALRIAASTMVIPAPPVNAAVAAGVIEVAKALRIDPQDPRITLSSGTYPNPRWRPDEDHAPYPVQSALVLGALGAALLARSTPGAVRGYAGAVLLAMLLTVATVKWQVWGNRLMLPSLMLGSVLVGWWASRLSAFSGVARGVHRTVVAVTLAVALLGAYGSVLYGNPRRLAGEQSVFTLTDWQERFARQPWRLAVYQKAADQIRASGAKRIGTVLRGDQWEYPFWLMLPDREFVAMESLVRDRPPAQATDVQAILCVSQDWLCQQIVPDTWRYEQLDNLTAVAFPQ